MKNIFTGIICTAAALGAHAQSTIGETTITKWQHDKRGAVSITYDDGTVNQFRVAIPIMNRLGLPGTFFINTGSLPGSTYKARFIGRPIAEIVAETETVPTSAENIFERASAARFVPVRGADDRFTRAGAQIDAGRMEQAYRIMDEFYAEVRGGSLEPLPAGTPASPAPDPNTFGGLTWDKVRMHTAEGHEFASHLVTHPYASALDEPNLLYELENSRDEIAARVDLRSTLSAECPYGTNDDRAMSYAMKVYPALRNRMGRDYIHELHRPDRRSPIVPDSEYVQWQRGVLSATTLAQMKEWADITAAQRNLWLVLVIHGVDGIGWEAMTGADMEAYFGHIAASDDLWVATFGDAARYIEERMNATLEWKRKGRRIVVTLDHPLDKALFDLPLTLKTRVDPAWERVRVAQGGSVATAEVIRDGDRTYVLYQATPGGGKIELRKQ